MHFIMHSKFIDRFFPFCITFFMTLHNFKGSRSKAANKVINGKLVHAHIQECWNNGIANTLSVPDSPECLHQTLQASFYAYLHSFSAAPGWHPPPLYSHSAQVFPRTQDFPCRQSQFCTSTRVDINACTEPSSIHCMYTTTALTVVLNYDCFGWLVTL